MLFKKSHNFILSAICLLSATSLVAQQLPPQQQQAPQMEITNDQLEKFVAASQKINMIQQGAQQEMVAMIEKEGLDVNQFNEMAAQQQNPNQESSSEITEADQQAFQNVMTKVQGMQMEMQQEMEKAVQSEEMQMQEYQQIMQAYEQDPNLQQQVNELMQQK